MRDNAPRQPHAAPVHLTGHGRRDPRAADALGKLVADPGGAGPHRDRGPADAGARRGGDRRNRRVDEIVNCAGASVTLGFGRGWRGYGAVDVPIGLAAVEARATGARGVRRRAARAAQAATAYVAATSASWRRCARCRAPRSCATGFYAAFAALLPMARRGRLIDVGDGRSRTNPIESATSPRVAGAALKESHNGVRRRGGWARGVHRREVFELVAAHAGRRVKVPKCPAGRRVRRARAPRGASADRSVRAVAAALAVADNVAPVLGTRRLADYLAALVRPS